MTRAKKNLCMVMSEGNHDLHWVHAPAEFQCKEVNNKVTEIECLNNHYYVPEENNLGDLIYRITYNDGKCTDNVFHNEIDIVELN